MNKFIHEIFNLGNEVANQTANNVSRWAKSGDLHFNRIMLTNTLNLMWQNLLVSTNVRIPLISNIKINLNNFDFGPPYTIIIET